MTTAYPASIDSFTNPTSSDNLNNPDHAAQHANANDAIEAIETELGTTPSLGRADVAALAQEILDRFEEDQLLQADTPGATYTIDFGLDQDAIDTTLRRNRTATLSTHTTLATSNLAAGRRLSIYLFAGASLRNLTFPVGWTFLGAAAPASIAANKVGRLDLFSTGFSDTNVIAQWTVQP